MIAVTTTATIAIAVRMLAGELNGVVAASHSA
jgi:hypothetical protein